MIVGQQVVQQVTQMCKLVQTLKQIQKVVAHHQAQEVRHKIPNVSLEGAVKKSAQSYFIHYQMCVTQKL